MGPPGASFAAASLYTKPSKKKIKLPIHTDLKTFNASLGGGGQYRLGSGGIGVRVV